MMLGMKLTLPDGRALAWEEFGDPHGIPLFFFHGLPGSRVFRFAEWQQAGATKFRVITTDRPGFGGSDPQPGRTLLDWPRDVAALADHLGISQYVVAGVSGGGPHALACAARPEGRVLACGLLSGAGPLDKPEDLKAMHSGNRLIFTLARRAPFLLYAVFGAQVWASNRGDPEKTLARMTSALAKALPPADVEVMRDPAIARMLMEASREATRHGGRWVAYEAIMLARPWGFTPSEVSVPTVLWQGEEDRNVPIAMGRKLASEIPGCVAYFEPAAGHLFTIRRWPEVQAELLALIRAGDAVAG